MAKSLVKHHIPTVSIKSNYNVDGSFKITGDLEVNGVKITPGISSIVSTEGGAIYTTTDIDKKVTIHLEENKIQRLNALYEIVEELKKNVGVSGEGSVHDSLVELQSQIENIYKLIGETDVDDSLLGKIDELTSRQEELEEYVEQLKSLLAGDFDEDILENLLSDKLNKLLESKDEDITKTINDRLNDYIDIKRGDINNKISEFNEIYNGAISNISSKNEEIDNFYQTSASHLQYIEENRNLVETYISEFEEKKAILLESIESVEGEVNKTLETVASAKDEAIDSIQSKITVVESAKDEAIGSIQSKITEVETVKIDAINSIQGVLGEVSDSGELALESIKDAEEIAVKDIKDATEEVLTKISEGTLLDIEQIVKELVENNIQPELDKILDTEDFRNTLNETVKNSISDAENAIRANINEIKDEVIGDISEVEKLFSTTKDTIIGESLDNIKEKIIDVANKALGSDYESLIQSLVKDTIVSETKKFIENGEISETIKNISSELITKEVEEYLNSEEATILISTTVQSLLNEEEIRNIVSNIISTEVTEIVKIEINKVLEGIIETELTDVVREEITKIDINDEIAKNVQSLITKEIETNEEIRNQISNISTTTEEIIDSLISEKISEKEGEIQDKITSEIDSIGDLIQGKVDEKQDDIDKAVDDAIKSIPGSLQGMINDRVDEKVDEKMKNVDISNLVRDEIDIAFKGELEYIESVIDDYKLDKGTIEARLSALENGVTPDKPDTPIEPPTSGYVVGESFKTFEELKNYDDLKQNYIYSVTDKGTIEQYILNENGEIVQISGNFNLSVDETVGSVDGYISTIGTSLLNGQTQFVCNMPELVNGNYLFKNCQMTIFVSDTPALTSGVEMFFNTGLESFCGTLYELTNGENMFVGCQLDEESVLNIVDTIKDVRYMEVKPVITLHVKESLDIDFIVEMNGELKNKNWDPLWNIDIPEEN